MSTSNLDQIIKDSIPSVDEAEEATKPVEDNEPEISNTEEVVTEEQTQEESYPEETVQEAKKYGHLSKEEWVAAGKDPKLWKTPGEFNDFGHKVSAKIQSLTEKIEALVDNQKRNTEQAYYTAKQELEKYLQQAKDNGDVESVAQLSAQKSQIDAEQIRMIQAKEAAEANRVDAAFKERNKHWFGISPDLTEEATAVGKQVIAKQPGLAYWQIAKQVEDYMLFTHPELVVSNRPAPYISQSRSAVNKSVASGSPQGHVEKQLKSLSQDDQMDFEMLKRAYDRMGIKDQHGKVTEYTINDFINSKNTKRG